MKTQYLYCIENGVQQGKESGKPQIGQMDAAALGFPLSGNFIGRALTQDKKERRSEQQEHQWMAI